MSIRILRDPNNPLGGHALLVVPHPGSGAVVETRLRFLRLEDRMFLGNHGWVANEEVLGPFALVPQGDDLAVALGPDVVNAMEPFQQLTIDALDLKLSASLGWPDDIMPLRQAKVRRGIMTAGAELHEKPTALRGRINTGAGAQSSYDNAGEPPQRSAASEKPEAARSDQEQPIPESSRPDPSEETAASVAQDLPPAVTPDKSPGSAADHEVSTPVADVSAPREKETEQKKSAKPLLLVLVAVAVAAVLAGAGVFLLGEDEVEPPVAEVKCDVQTVAEAEQSVRWEMVGTCIGVGKARDALPLVERLVANGHGPAQLQLGKWLDPEEIGTSPMEPRNPNTAMRLYGAARDAGLDDAVPLIKRLCESLDGQRGLNAQMTHKKYCEGG
ncbi:hypothetical protein [Pelagibius sp. Alg239-R121]|uniref:hypothetical protein n=1 Tax=Pelagibius sp. Alg239-R121 TaxID=2993448 RepID=UPI0024A72D5D|nr:hypothetical protein [Pelagibius sp. Alg239-R121]